MPKIKNSHKKHLHKGKNKTQKNKPRKNKTRTNNFIKTRCSPKNDGKNLNFTCYTRESLYKLKKIWNKRHPDVLIKSNNPKDIWDQLRYNLKSSCNSEECWLRHQCIKLNIDKNLWEDTFAPMSPIEWKKKPNEWLTSVDIDKVMKQWERGYQCFEFIGPSPIDYDKHHLFGECVWEELCKFSLIDMKKRGKNKIGIIFNLDPHYKEGSHWVALFIDIRKKQIYYCDSYGEKPPKRIMKFVKEVQQQAIQINDEYTFHQVTKRHQYSDSECGMYSLYFIIQLLKDRPFSYFQKKKIPDSYMKKLRKIYFNE